MKKMYYVLIVIAAVLWGSTGIFTTIMGNHGVASTEMSLLRSCVATIVIGVIYLVKDRSVFKLEKITDLKYFIGMGIVSYAFFNWCYIMAIKETSMGVAAILLYTAPAIIMVLSVILFKEKLTKKKVVILLITFVGCILVTGLENGMDSISTKGLLFGMGSGIGYALYSIFGKYALKKYSSITAVFYMFLMSSIPFCITTNPIDAIQTFTDTNMWGVGIIFSIVAAVLPYLTYTKALAHVEASKASLIATLEPIVAAVFGIVLFAEEANLSKIIGITLVIGAVIVMSREKG
ncbi:MAG: DMT family transporter [Eubacteriales bacterium]